MPKNYKVSSRRARRRLVQKERLHAMKGGTCNAATRQYNAHQVLSSPSREFTRSFPPGSVLASTLSPLWRGAKRETARGSKSASCTSANSLTL